MPIVRGVSNGVPAPADAEMIIEGYFDEHGYRDLEGPYGEFYGFYGPVHVDPVFQVTAITSAATCSDRAAQRMLSQPHQFRRTSARSTPRWRFWRALRALGIEPIAVSRGAGLERPPARPCRASSRPGPGRGARRAGDEGAASAGGPHSARDSASEARVDALLTSP